MRRGEGRTRPCFDDNFQFPFPLPVTNSISIALSSGFPTFSTYSTCTASWNKDGSDLTSSQEAPMQQVYRILIANGQTFSLGAALRLLLSTRLVIYSQHHTDISFACFDRLPSSLGPPSFSVYIEMLRGYF